MTNSPFRPEHFVRQDETDDGEFYAEPRLVVHIDERAIDALGKLYTSVLPPNDEILDLMSSWKSHMPAGFPVRRLVGLGMNETELRENDQLDDYVIHDLNRDPTLPFDHAGFGACVVAVSVQYLTRPVEVFREVNRVLRPGAPFVVTYSNRCFPTKAVALWQMLGDDQHSWLVGAYFDVSGGWTGLRRMNCTPGAMGSSDPLYAVLAKKAAPAPEPAGSGC